MSAVSDLSVIQTAFSIIVQVAYAAMVTPNGSDEKLLYQSIVSIPHYDQKRVSVMMDREDEETVVDDSFDAFREMYAPIIKKHFSDVMEIRDGKFYIDSDDRRTQKKLLMAVNDNVYKNLEGFSVKLFDESAKYSKEAFSTEQKELIVDGMLNHDRVK